MSTNGHHPSPEESSRRLEDADRAVENLTSELAKIEDLLESAEQHRETVRRAAVVAQGVRRSKLTALEKSQFIRARVAAGRIGPEAQADYMSLPW